LTGYPSDGIVQVEEEEEEFDNETYTIENDVRQRRLARAEKTSAKQRTYPRARNEAKGISLYSDTCLNRALNKLESCVNRT